MNDTADLKDLCIDEISKTYLKEIAMWGKFLAILGFVKSGILLLSSIVFPLIAHKIESHFNHDLPTLGMTLFFLLMAALAYFPSNYLFCFARYTKKALSLGDQDIMRHALQSLKAYCRFIGILFIIILCLYPIAIVTAIIIY
ncbi:hypothetical protein [Ancylomarina sp.]|uniref:hypothetical protein n=1 Tax=Ancylomarina sp. TaxID=1970196 RepID=UPI0035657E85